MAIYECSVCGWVYDEELGFPDGGIAQGTRFEELSDSWFCPFCSAEKDKFEKIPDQ